MFVCQMAFFGPGQVILSPDVEAKIRSRKEFALLAYLAVEHERAHSRESILGLLWPELEQEKARNNLRVALARLRKSIDHATHPLILSDRHTLYFDNKAPNVDGGARIDVVEFERLLSVVDSHEHTNPAQCPTCLADMVKAAELYQGEFLHGFHLDNCEAFEHWLLVQRERYQMQAGTLLSRLELAYIASQEWREAERIVRHHLSLDPLNEDAHRSLMRILALGGLRNAALSHYEICVRMLNDELSVKPDKATVALAEQIRAGNLQLTTADLRSESAESELVMTTAEIAPEDHTVNVNSKSKIVNPYDVLNRLDPLPDQTLFGVEKALTTVNNALDATNRSWLISIEGIGGLGKTTLANALVKKRLQIEKSAQTNPANLHTCKPTPFQDIGWISAKQEEYLPEQGVQSTGKPALDEESLMDQMLAQLSDGPYPTGSPQEKRLALTRLLQEKTCLVVVDNLETSVDYQALLPLMRHLANPSKFLITSRVSLSGQGDVFCYSLSELSEDDALVFLRHEATNRGMTALAEASDEQLQIIYATVGGNPLALKLVLGQLQFLPLDQVLTSLRLADTERTDQLYTYIYWQAWQMLDEPSQQLLLSLPVAPNATFAQLQSISGLNIGALQAAIMNLRNLSLVEMGGDLNETRYRLHRLTETFLMHEVVKWQSSEAAELQGAEAEFFVERVLQMVEQWGRAEAVHAVDVTILDHEYESVVKAISLGLELDEGWTKTKPLIIAFTPFMERRGHWHKWHSILERAIEAARRAADLDGEITLTALLARLCQRESRPKDVVYYYRRVIRMAQRSGNRYEEARACSNLGYAYIDGGRWWRSEVLSRHALKIFEELGSEHGRAHTHNHLGLLYTRQAKWETAKQHLNLACNIWEKQEQSYSLIDGYMNLGLMFIEMKEPERALRYLSKAYSIAETTNEVTSMAKIWNNMSAAYQLKLDWANANKFAHKAERLFKEHANYFELANVWNNLGLIAFGLQCRDLARKYLEKSLDIHVSLNNSAGIRMVKDELQRIMA